MQPSQKAMTKRRYFPLSQSQQKVWELENSLGGAPVHILGGMFLSKEVQDSSRWLRAINKYLISNESFHLRFALHCGEPVQYVEPFTTLDVPVEDLTVNTGEELKEWAQNQVRIGFSLYESRLFDFHLVEASDGVGFFAKFHSLVGDNWTLAQMAKEIYAIVTDPTETTDVSSVFDKTSYLEFVNREGFYLKSESFTKDRNYWLSKFVDEDMVSSLKLSMKDDVDFTARRVMSPVALDDSIAIRDFCRRNEMPLFVVVEASLRVYAKRFLSISRLTVGVSFFDQSRVLSIAPTGQFTNSLPIPLTVYDDETFLQLCERIVNEHEEARGHCRYPSRILIADLQSESDIPVGRLDIHVIHEETDALDFSTIELVFNGHLIESMQVGLLGTRDLGSLELRIDYRESAFLENEVNYIAKRLLHMIIQGTTDCATMIGEMDLLDDKEKMELLVAFNDTKQDYPKSKSLGELFADQVQKTPETAAIVFHGKSTSYRELAGMAKQIAAGLVACCYSPDTPVALLLNRSDKFLAAQLGVLETGGYYLPIDLASPEERIRFIIEDSGARVLVSTEAIINRYSFPPDVTLLSVDSLLSTKLPYNGSNTQVERSNLAYLIYTSGSTGRPKGTLISEQNVINYCSKSPLNVYGGVITSDLTRILSITSVSFDIFITESILPLLNGMTVILADEKEVTFPSRFDRLVSENQAEVLQTTPTRMRLLMSDPDSLSFLEVLRVVMVGGEPFPPMLYQELRKLTNARVFNLYGPTEATVWSSYAEIESENITIGHPIANTQLYILGDHLQLLPVGVTGEIYIGGDGVAFGYHNQPKLTKERFLRNPFLPGGRMYKTGDLGYWTPSGQIVHQGRNDFQVKIRGLRVELGEIESVLQQYPDVLQAIVGTLLDHEGNLVLYACYNSEIEISSISFRNFLKDRLLQSMIPSIYIMVTPFPLLPSGKIDRGALQKHVTASSKTGPASGMPFSQP